MAERLEVVDFLEKINEAVVVDVRSPSEFRKGHIPGALNIPLFDDEERAEVGTLYTQKSRDHAILRGLNILLPKVGSMRSSILKTVPSKNLLLYCWRGGMRSSSMGAFLEAAGFTVSLLTGGYKAYRRYIRAKLSEPANILILGGYTGSGKTEILQTLRKRGEQVIDLENLAAHKGSVFGSLGMPKQPSTEQFENDLFEEWKKIDPRIITWIEDESRMIGKVVLPDPIVRNIEMYPLLLLEIPINDRINRLVNEYAGIDDQYLIQAVNKIGDRLGSQQVTAAIRGIQDKAYSLVADHMLHYYDKAYAFSVNRRKEQHRYPLVIDKTNPDEVAGEILTFVQTHLTHESNIP